MQLLAREAINAISEPKGAGLAFAAATICAVQSTGLKQGMVMFACPQWGTAGRTVGCLFALLVGTS